MSSFSPISPLQPQRTLGRRLAMGAGSLWRHSFRAVMAAVVLFVVLKTARRMPSGGSSDTMSPQSLQAVSPQDRTINWPAKYAWLSRKAQRDYAPLADRIPPPPGFVRTSVARGSFGEWLRNLPVAPAKRAVTNARRQVLIPPDDPRIAAVIELQPGNANLLQAACMVVRLRAEYAWTTGNVQDVSFHYTSGHEAKWSDWAAGARPKVNGKQVQFEHTGQLDDSRESYCSYLETLFRYSTVYSIHADTKEVEDGTVMPGDILIATGRQGHAAIVLDVASSADGHVVAMLGQGGTPAQTFHVPRNPADGSAWFAITDGGTIQIPAKPALKINSLRRWH